jgi:ThiF family
VSAGVEVRIPRNVWARLWEEVRRPAPYEPVVFGLVSHAQTADGILVLVRDIIVPPTTAFVQSTAHGAKWSGAYNISLLNAALEHGLGILIFHYHAGTDQVKMSRDDEQSARQLLPVFQTIAPQRPHGSVVLGENSMNGLIGLPGTSRLLEDFRLRFFGDNITTFPHGQVSTSNLARHRSPLLDDAVTRSLLGDMVVAVVGLSGGGTQVVRHLSCLGIDEIVGIDSQRVTPDNLLATGEFGWPDVLLRRRKTAAARSKLRWTNRRIRFTAVNSLVPETRATEALKRVDLIIGCVNNLNARADLQEIAWRYCIPYVDMGLGLYPLDPDDELSELAAISGNVFAAIPGGACLWCTGFLNDEKLEREAGGANRSYLRTTLAARSRNSSAYVASFNGVLAGLAVADVLQLILGHAPTIAIRKQYDALSGTVSEVVVEKSPQCLKCSAVLAAGDPLWQ